MVIQNPLNLALPESMFGGGLVLPYQDFVPKIGADVFLAPNATLIGRVTLGDRVNLWVGVVLRGDIAPIVVGAGSNVQDNSVLHVGSDDPCIVGSNVNVGHNVTLHGCTVEDDCLIGIGAIILNKAVIGRGSVVGAGALVTQGTIVPPDSLVLGAPAKVRRALTDAERKEHGHFAAKYIGVAESYRAMFRA